MRSSKFTYKILVLFFSFLFIPLHAQTLISSTWLHPSSWTPVLAPSCSLSIGVDSLTIPGEKCLALKYSLSQSNGWVHIEIPFDDHNYDMTSDSLPISFLLKSASLSSKIQAKILTKTDSTFLRDDIDLGWNFSTWKKVVLYRKDMHYGWGGSSQGSLPIRFGIAVTGADTGTVLVRSLIIDTPHLLSTFVPHPVADCESRTAAAMVSMDTGVIAWMKRMQDNAATGGILLPALEDNNLQTYTNAICSIAFMVTGERQRAERILDFYSMVMDSTLQNGKVPSFYHEQEPRGIFQSIIFKQADSSYSGDNDRWIGDMAWLLAAYKRYETIFDSNRYVQPIAQLKNFLLSIYRKDPAGGAGFIMTGWQNNDAYFDSTGHVEGNIDCYSALLLCGETATAASIKKWLDSRWGNGLDHPLDEYTWRVLAFGRDSLSLIKIPECDKRFWKEDLEFNGSKVSGVYCYPLLLVNNIFIEGNAHLACAYYMAGDSSRGNFYANTLDSFLQTNGDVKYLPYTANNGNSDFSWVTRDKGMASTAAWYVIAKCKINPLSTNVSSTSVQKNKQREKNRTDIRVFKMSFNKGHLTLIVHHNKPVSFSDAFVADLRGRVLIRLSCRYSTAASTVFEAYDIRIPLSKGIKIITLSENGRWFRLPYSIIN